MEGGIEYLSHDFVGGLQEIVSETKKLRATGNNKESEHNFDTVIFGKCMFASVRKGEVTKVYHPHSHMFYFHAKI